MGGATVFEPAGSVNRVVVWDVKTGREQLTIKDPRDSVIASAFSPDGSFIATGGYDATVSRIWDASTGRLRRELAGHLTCVNQIVFNGDGTKMASASDDNSVILWDTAKLVVLFRVSGHRGGIMYVAFSPDGKQIATSGFDGQIKLWDATRSGDCRTVGDIAGSARVSSLAFHPSGNLLAAACSDRTVRAPVHVGWTDFCPLDRP